MKRIICIWVLLVPIGIFVTGQNPYFSIEGGPGDWQPRIVVQGKTVLSSPEEGLWSIATGWDNKWPSNWHHASPQKYEQVGEWQIVSGEITLPEGVMKLRDSYIPENGLIKCVRRFEWTGQNTIDSVTLTSRWIVPGQRLKPFLPGILYYGNPSGARNTPDCVPAYEGTEGEIAIFEDHRFPMPFVCLEESGDIAFGAVVHTMPSQIRNSRLFDHWWSAGIRALKTHSEIVLMSGPIAYNRNFSVAKALQCKMMDYDNTYLSMMPGGVIEKTFYLDAYEIEMEGTAFEKPVHDAINLYKPFYYADLPSYSGIIESKLMLASSRWIEDDGYAGFNMYEWSDRSRIVMGWCGQAASPGYALQVLRDRTGNMEETDTRIQRSLDFLSGSPVGETGFPVIYNPATNEWSRPDHVSMGQAMYNFAKAIETARKNNRYDISKWEVFLKKACDAAAARINSADWYPVSTAEGFYAAPLAIASELFGMVEYRNAAIKVADHYANRHLNMQEPYWGGTLDASGEDKEGAWAAFQAFLSVYEMTGESKYLDYAKHACNVCLSYTVVWDIPLPAGRMAEKMFKTRGWTAVSPQNQHIDVFGVFFTPEIYRLGIITGDQKLMELAKVMFLSCGQLIDPYGSQGEQLQQTNYAQAGDMSDVYRLRGGYVERWTVFWITSHFLNAAARFEEMGVKL